MTPNEWLQLQRTVAASVVLDLFGMWRTLDDESSIGTAWTAQIPVAFATVATGQAAAARRATEYVSDQVPDPDPAGEVNPAAFAGIASDGRPLATLLQLPVVAAIRALQAGTSAPVALQLGRQRLGLLAATQVYDAGRQATAVAQVAEREIYGYRRNLRGGGNCSRCVVLAGRLYRWNDGFLRHPRCDCMHVPVLDPGGRSNFDERDYFKSLTAEEQERVFTVAGAKAIRDGADIGQVVNARRGMKTTTAYGKKVLATTEGTTDTAFAGRRLASAGEDFARQQSLNSTTTRGATRTRRRVAIPRLMPEQIYADAKNRDDAIRLLIRFGYI